MLKIKEGENDDWVFLLPRCFCSTRLKKARVEDVSCFTRSAILKYQKRGVTRRRAGGTDAGSFCFCRTQKSPTGFPWRGFSIKFPAATYSPTQLPMQYHRPREA